MKRKKKVLWLVLLIAILPITTSTMIDVAEACPIKVYVDPHEILDTGLGPGEEFTVNIVVDFVSEPSAYQFGMSFNPHVLHAISVENGPFLGSAGGEVMVFGSTPQFNNTAGLLNLFGVILNPPDEKNPTGEEGVLAVVTFEVVGIGGSPIRLAEEKDMTMLLNTTGGTEFDGEIAEAWIRVPGEPAIPNPGFLGHGYFDNRPQLWVEPPLETGVSIGRNFTVDVNVADVTDLYSWEFYMNWSIPLLNVTSVIEGGFLKSQPDGTQFHQEMHNDEGYIYVNCTRTGASGVDGGGTLANITFLVEGEGNSTQHLYNTKLLDSTGGAILVGTGDGWFSNSKFHNIAVARVRPYPIEVEAGSEDPIYVNVTVTNTGTFNETGINVAAYSDENEIGRETGISLDRGASRTLTFVWNTTGVSVGRYSITANATILEGESDTADNRRIFGLVTLSGINIAVMSVRTSVATVYLGDNVTVKIRIENLGSETVTFNITAYYSRIGGAGHGVIGMETVPRLGYEEGGDMFFVWDTTGLELGNYTIGANATILTGESNITDNSRYRAGPLRLVQVEPPPLIDPFYALVIVVVVIVGSLFFLNWWRKRSQKAKGAHSPYFS